MIFVLTNIGVFLAVILLLVVLLLVAKRFLSPEGEVDIEVNGKTHLNVKQGGNLMATLNENGIYLPSLSILIISFLFTSKVELLNAALSLIFSNAIFAME